MDNQKIKFCKALDTSSINYLKANIIYKTSHCFVDDCLVLSLLKKAYILLFLQKEAHSQIQTVAYLYFNFRFF